MMRKFDIVVAGGGPAGIAAAVRAAECGKRVAVIDDNFSAGGQIWRGRDVSSPNALEWRARLQAANVTAFMGTRIFGKPAQNVLRAEQEEECIDIGYQKLILATGARERFLPFPGWTLPNVTGAGALQALVKQGLSVGGKRVVVAGSGPLLPAVAAYLRRHGARVMAICEQAPLRSLVHFAISAFADFAKLRQAVALKSETFLIPYYTSCWPVSAQGANQVESVTLQKGGKRWSVDCDYLACGFHLVPNLELVELLGCEIQDGKVVVDEWQRTTSPHIYCAGELSGVGGVELALVEGQIAGYASAGQPDRARPLFKERRQRHRFAQRLAEAFALRDALKKLPLGDTLVCRCEDVPYHLLSGHESWRAAKLHTRCGMGPCQGRICGAAAEFLFRWNVSSIRPPILPATLSSLGIRLPEITSAQEKQ